MVTLGDAVGIGVKLGIGVGVGAGVGEIIACVAVWVGVAIDETSEGKGGSQISHDS